MYEFLTSTSVSLMSTINASSNLTFLQKVLVLLVIFYKCKMLDHFSQTNHPAIKCFLKNLGVNDGSCLSTEFFVHYQKSIAEVLRILISNSVKLKPPTAEWIFAVPLLHFMMNKCKPYEQLKGMTWDHDNSARRVYW